MDRPYFELINKPVLVFWSDSMTAHGWVTIDDEQPLDELPTIVSMGYLIKENSKGILLVADLSTHEEGHRDANRPIKIPKGCIQDILELRAV